jgi:uncharacterized membrane protein YsdA (DUF1294 family)/cold shock CspA family protein
MEFEGVLVQWNDERGFGFLEPVQGGQQIFAHIKSFSTNGRPKLNQRYVFKVETNHQGKKRAFNVRPCQSVSKSNLNRPNKSRINNDAPAQWGIATLFVIPLFVVVYVLCASLFKVPRYTFAVYVASSFLLFMMYVMDKAAAKSNQRRIPESNLHAIALLSGWPGALIAQQFLRHKSVKAEFRQVFWATVVLNVIAFVGISIWLK